MNGLRVARINWFFSEANGLSDAMSCGAFLSSEHGAKDRVLTANHIGQAFGLGQHIPDYRDALIAKGIEQFWIGLPFDDNGLPKESDRPSKDQVMVA